MRIAAGDFLNRSRVEEIDRFLDGQAHGLGPEVVTPLKWLTGVLRSDTALPPLPPSGPERLPRLPPAVDAIVMQLILGGREALPPAVHARICSYYARFSDAADVLYGAPPPGERPALLSFERRPTVGEPHALMLCRRYWSGPSSRLHDIGPRIAQGLRNGGWRATLLDPAHDRTLLLDLLRGQQRFAASFVDIMWLQTAFDARTRAAVLGGLRRIGGPVVLLLFDPWSPDEARAPATYRDVCDFVWYCMPSSPVDRALPLAQHIRLPFPVGIEGMFAPPTPPADVTRAQFVGSISGFNRPRLLWYCALQEQASRAVFVETGHEADGLSCEDSLRRYFDKLTASRTAINFTQRSNGRRSVTGRTWDTLSLGQLLLQERCEDAHYYFTEGEEFLEFSTLDELLQLADEALQWTPRVARIAEAGHHAHESRYSDQAITEALNAFLLPST